MTTKTEKTDEPVLYYVGPGSKPTVPARDLFEADLRKRSKEALIATGLYADKKPK